VNRFAQINAAIKAHYIGQGRTEEQWETVSGDPAKFNQVWRHALRLAPDTTPPPKEWRNINPSTGEILL
jgi:hypothetical protein